MDTLVDHALVSEPGGRISGSALLPGTRLRHGPLSPGRPRRLQAGLIVRCRTTRCSGAPAAVGGSTPSATTGAVDAIRVACAPDYDRLDWVERRYDPDNVSPLDHDIAPRPTGRVNPHHQGARK
jgi:hypothetical protein